MLCAEGRKQHDVGAPRKLFADAYKRGKDKRAKVQRANGRGRDQATLDAGLPGDFEIEDGWIGVWKLVGNAMVFVPAVNEFRNVGFLFDETGHGLGHLLEFTDELGVSREIAYQHHETVRDAGAFLGRMAQRNMRFKGGEEAHKLAGVLFADMPDGDPILNVSKPGFHQYTGGIPVYVPLLGGVMHAAGAEHNVRVRLQESARLPVETTRGDLDGWKHTAGEILKVCDFHSTMILGASFAGCLVSLLNVPSCGMNFTGLAGGGKSLSMKVGAALWGPVMHGDGLFVSASASGTGGELSAAKANGATYFLDEIARMDARLRQAAIMMLAEGTGKVRGTADVALRKTTSWSIYFVVSGEIDFDKMIDEGGGTKAGGIDRRLPEFDTTGTKVWHDLEHIKRLEGSVDDHYGHGGPAFVQYLFDQGYVSDEGRQRLNQQIADRAKVLLGDGGGARSGAVQSAAYVVATAYVAALLARDAGLFPVVEGRDIDADFLMGWRDRCKLGEEGGDTAGSAAAAIPAFWGKFDSLWTMHGCDLSDPDAPLPLREAHFFTHDEWLTDDGRPFAVIREDGISLLHSKAIKLTAILRELGDDVLRESKKNLKWKTFPAAGTKAEKPGPNYRIVLPPGWRDE